MENFGIFVTFGVNLRYFHYKTAVNSSGKPTRQHIFSLLTLFNVSIDEVGRKFGKKCIKLLKIEKFSDFCHFLCQFETFSIEHCNYLVIKDYWTTHHIFSLLTLKNIPIHEVCRNFNKKLHKNFENWKILGFFLFSVSI